MFSDLRLVPLAKKLSARGCTWFRCLKLGDPDAWGFPARHAGTPTWMVMENPTRKWMMTGGTPMSFRYGGVLKYGYPQIIHFLVGFSTINHPIFGVPPFMETSISWFMNLGLTCTTCDPILIHFVRLYSHGSDRCTVDPRAHNSRGDKTYVVD